MSRCYDGSFVQNRSTAGVEAKELEGHLPWVFFDGGFVATDDSGVLEFQGDCYKTFLNCLCGFIFKNELQTVRERNQSDENQHFSVHFTKIWKL